MNEVQNVKQVFQPSAFQNRILEDPRRLYGFLLCTDEHQGFISFVQSAWRTLDALSGDACDIFTLEKWEMPDQRLASSRYIQLGTGDTQPRIVDGEGRYEGQHVFLDNGVMLPDRVQCLKVRDELFKNPRQIVLPGFAIFASREAGNAAAYYPCGRLSPAELSDSFQQILGSANEAYHAGENRMEAFQYFQKIERKRSIKEKFIKTLTNLSLKDLIDLLSKLHLSVVTPKRT
jgi:hypothetical protein